MQLTVSLLLVIVAVNVAILVYARTATRQGEIAVSTALGASRAGIVAQLFIESLVLCRPRCRRRTCCWRGRHPDGPTHHGDSKAAGFPYWIDERHPRRRLTSTSPR